MYEYGIVVMFCTMILNSTFSPCFYCFYSETTQITQTTQMDLCKEPMPLKRRTSSLSSTSYLKLIFDANLAAKLTSLLPQFMKPSVTDALQRTREGLLQMGRLRPTHVVRLLFRIVLLTISVNNSVKHKYYNYFYFLYRHLYTSFSSVFMLFVLYIFYI